MELNNDAIISNLCSDIVRLGTELNAKLKEAEQVADHFKQLAEHRGNSIEQLLNVQGKQSTEIERLYQQRNQLMGALELAEKYIKEQEIPTFTDDKGRTHLVQSPDIRGYATVMSAIHVAITSAKGNN